MPKESFPKPSKTFLSGNPEEDKNRYHQIKEKMSAREPLDGGDFDFLNEYEDKHNLNEAQSGDFPNSKKEKPQKDSTKSKAPTLKKENLEKPRVIKDFKDLKDFEQIEDSVFEISDELSETEMKELEDSKNYSNLEKEKQVRQAEQKVLELLKDLQTEESQKEFMEKEEIQVEKTPTTGESIEGIQTDLHERIESIADKYVMENAENDAKQLFQEYMKAKREDLPQDEIDRAKLNWLAAKDRVMELDGSLPEGSREVYFGDSSEKEFEKSQEEYLENDRLAPFREQVDTRSDHLHSMIDQKDGFVTPSMLAKAKREEKNAREALENAKKNKDIYFEEKPLRYHSPKDTSRSEGIKDSQPILENNPPKNLREKRKTSLLGGLKDKLRKNWHYAAAALGSLFIVGEGSQNTEAAKSYTTTAAPVEKTVVLEETPSVNAEVDEETFVVDEKSQEKFALYANASVENSSTVVAKKETKPRAPVEKQNPEDVFVQQTPQEKLNEKPKLVKKESLFTFGKETKASKELVALTGEEKVQLDNKDYTIVKELQKGDAIVQLPGGKYVLQTVGFAYGKLGSEMTAKQLMENRTGGIDYLTQAEENPKAAGYITRAYKQISEEQIAILK